jgi:hypothetical protein
MHDVSGPPLCSASYEKSIKLDAGVHIQTIHTHLKIPQEY